jgi:hypothetical protein
MSAITTLVENAIIADLLLDSTLAQFTIVPHDETAQKDPTAAANPHALVIVVTAFDWGDFSWTWGAGIRTIHVEVEINMSITEKNYGLELDQIVDLISTRLQPSTTIAGVTNRDFSVPGSLKVFGILDQSIKDLRNDLDKEGVRQRIIERTFVAAQLA